MVPIRLGPQACADLTAGREWLVADGCGGYAMGTVGGIRTRRYHGLLVLADPAVPALRRLALAALDPVVILPSGAEVRLGTHEWSSGAIDPVGHRLLASFDLDDGLPRWRWQLGDVVIERELAMAGGAVGVIHRILAGGPVTLALEAVVTWRDAHGERRANGPPPRCVPTAGGVRVEEAFRLAGPGWAAGGQWWRGVHYREEAARGLTADEDLWYAGRFVAHLNAVGATADVTGWTDGADAVPPAADLVASVRRRRRTLAARVAARASGPLDADVVGSLAIAADAFVVRRSTPGAASASDVVAGYPWFGSWSRDTMLSYPGLFLATGRADEGRELLRGYAATLSGGMLANTADTGEQRYNTVDGTLWFAYAIERHVTATGDADLAAELAPALRTVLGAHLDGVRYGIRATGDGLLTQGAEGEALTWMDARVDGVAITPRVGCPVEVNALWINALAAVEALSLRAAQPATLPTGRDVAAVGTVLGAARSAFAARFPRPDGTLADLVGGQPEAAVQLRPNQLLAWSLPYPAAAPNAAGDARVGGALLTPLGLRTLAPADPAYRPFHRGGPADRDGAYHQGTVWPWLIGPYVDAARRLGGPAASAVPPLLDGLVRHLGEYGLGSISETADGAAPHAATGCPFQAWSVAELLRVGTTDH
jgi:predicted glycogen debranching enzyme